MEKFNPINKKNYNEIKNNHLEILKRNLLRDFEGRLPSIELKKNFFTTLDYIYNKIEDSIKNDSTEEDEELKKEIFNKAIGDINSKIFVLLNRLRTHNTKPSSGSLTAMALNRKRGVDSLIDSNLKDIQYIFSLKEVKSITGMQNGRGIPKKEELDWFLNEFKDDKELLKSITGMQNGRGIPKKEELDWFLNEFKDDKGNIDKIKLKKVTSKQEGVENIIIFSNKNTP